MIIPRNNLVDRGGERESPVILPTPLLRRKASENSQKKQKTPEKLHLQLKRKQSDNLFEQISRVGPERSQYSLSSSLDDDDDSDPETQGTAPNQFDELTRSRSNEPG